MLEIIMWILIGLGYLVFVVGFSVTIGQVIKEMDR